jgi:protein involved in polysaccharide export with SLBB domain
MAGGLTAAARAQNCFLVRRTEKGQKRTPVNLSKIARGSRPELYLQPGDTFVVGSSVIAKLGEFVGIGLNYSPIR